MATEQIPTTLIADDAVTGDKIENNPTVAGNLTVSGTSTLTGNSTVGGTLATTGAFTASGGIANSGTITAGTLGSSVVSPASVGGIWKLLNRTVISGSPTSVEFVNGTGGVVINHSTYSFYKVICTGLGSTSDVHNLSCQFGKSSAYLAANYKYVGFDRRSDSTDNTPEDGAFQHIPLGHSGASNVGATDSGEQNLQSIVEFSLHADTCPTLAAVTVYWMDNNNANQSTTGCTFQNSAYFGDDIDRIRFFFHPNYYTGTVGTFSTMANKGSISFYGLKTS